MSEFNPKFTVECDQTFTDLIHEIDKEVLRDTYKAIRRRHLQWRLAHDFESFSLRQRNLFESDRKVQSDLARDTRERLDGNASSAWFLTVNPPPSVSLGDLWEDVKVQLERSRTIVGWHMVIEQRSEDVSNPSGWHVHVCMNLDPEAPLSRSQMKSRFKTLIEKYWTPEDLLKTDSNDRRRKLIDWSWFVLKPLAEHHRCYVEGEKRPDKMAKVAVDRQVRSLYGFPPAKTGGAEIIFPGTCIVENGLPSSISQEAPDGTS